MVLATRLATLGGQGSPGEPDLAVLNRDVTSALEGGEKTLSEEVITWDEVDWKVEEGVEQKEEKLLYTSSTFNQKVFANKLQNN